MTNNQKYGCESCRNKDICKFVEEMMVTQAEAKSIKKTPESPINVMVHCVCHAPASPQRKCKEDVYDETFR